MTTLRLDDLRQHTDILRLHSGKTLAVRFVEPDDAEALQGYFRALSVRSRYNRFLGAMSELPHTELDHFIHVGERDRFSVIAVMVVDGVETIVGEARYGFEAAATSFEFGVSVDDRWQGQGIGSALLRNLECRAAALGAGRVFGDTLRSNDVMMGLARKSGFSFTLHPDDWKLVRFEKSVDVARQEIPCASWRLAEHVGWAKRSVVGTAQAPLPTLRTSRLDSSLRGAMRRSNPYFRVWPWIASLRSQ